MVVVQWWWIPWGFLESVQSHHWLNKQKSKLSINKSHRTRLFLAGWWLSFNPSENHESSPPSPEMWCVSTAVCGKGRRWKTTFGSDCNPRSSSSSGRTPSGLRFTPSFNFSANLSQASLSARSTCWILVLLYPGGASFCNWLIKKRVYSSTLANDAIPTKSKASARLVRASCRWRSVEVLHESSWDLSFTVTVELASMVNSFLGLSSPNSALRTSSPIFGVNIQKKSLSCHHNTGPRIGMGSLWELWLPQPWLPHLWRFDKHPWSKLQKIRTSCFITCDRGMVIQCLNRNLFPPYTMYRTVRKKMYFIKQILTGFQTPQKTAQTKQPSFFGKGTNKKSLSLSKVVNSFLRSASFLGESILKSWRQSTYLWETRGLIAGPIKGHQWLISP